MTTLARPTTSDASHWYDRQGNPVHTVKCSTKDGERPTTIADARKLGLLPSVTNILRVLHKPALESWKIEQACLSVLTAPRGTNEELDAFVQRVLHDERQQEQEAKKAADLGTRIHRALEDELSGRVADHEMLPWIEPVWNHLNTLGWNVVATELVVVGSGYAGRTDVIFDMGHADCVVDFKSTKKLPSKSYWEHQMQTASYNLAFVHQSGRHRDYIPSTMNIYISTTQPGEFVCHQQKDCSNALKAFQRLVEYWQIANDFYP